jgi:hypothetical protein
MGARRPSAIARAFGRTSAAEILPPLTRLLEIGVIERVSALARHEGGRIPTRYEIADPFLSFWYRYIDPRRGAIRRVRSAAEALALAGEDRGGCGWLRCPDGVRGHVSRDPDLFLSTGRVAA